MSDERKEARDLIDELGMLEDIRQNTDMINQDVSKYVLPGHGWWPSDSVNTVRGERRADDRLDGTATFAARVMAAGQQGGMASPTSPWFRLALEDDSLMERPGAKWWLTEVENRMYAAYARSRFYQAIHQFYLELDCFGTGALFQDIDKLGNLQFQSLTFGEYCLAVNESGMVDTMFRRVPLTARALVRWFGRGKCSDAAVRMAEENPFDDVEILHVVRPRHDLDPRKIDNRNMPFESVYLEMQHQNKILRKSGYVTFPFHVARYNETGGEPYGRGPGHDALPSVKELMDMQISLAMMVHRISDEPTQTDAQTANNIDTSPGAVNVGQGKLEPVFSRLPDPTPLMRHIAEKKMEIREFFHNGVFLLDAQAMGKNPTATEVMQRKAEMLLQLGPSTERQQAELYDPCIDRTFQLLWAAGRLPPVPESLSEVPYKVTYVSTLARAQRAAGKSAIRDAVQFVMELAPAAQEVLDNLNIDETVKEYIELSDVSSNILTESDQRQAIREGRQKAAQAQQAQQAAMDLAGAAKDLGGIKTNERNGATDLLRAMGGGR